MGKKEEKKRGFLVLFYSCFFFFLLVLVWFDLIFFFLIFFFGGAEGVRRGQKGTRMWTELGCMMGNTQRINEEIMLKKISVAVTG